ncbi:hypothetical protein A8139_05655 [Marinomonas primoryensis]|uniref:Phage protein n=1 Tax=Marinomonas primoryensis TaxID=178399 RepID=A0A2Z4PQ14_9GAMM|nr:hypothetical protein [Marinomonas primoryensis]AWX99536.1 hypothetical protein A8139_05655 [Marinomonas primoryensis]
MKNTLLDLNNHLFAQMERLSDEKLSKEKLEREIERSRAITGVSKSIVSNASLQLQALKLKAEHHGLSKNDMPNELLKNEQKLIRGGQ